MPPNKLAADAYRLVQRTQKDPKHTQSGCVRRSTIQVSVEEIAESGNPPSDKRSDVDLVERVRDLSAKHQLTSAGPMLGC
jgi:hypothetical protein